MRSLVLVQKDVIALNCGFDRGPVKADKRKEVVVVGAKRKKGRWCWCKKMSLLSIAGLTVGR